jgi:hypothetical protein
MYYVVYVSIRQPKYISDPRRFFLEPASTKQRQYEALRAYFVEQRPSAEVARAFGYTPGSFQVMCHHFRHNTDPVFFVSPHPGPRYQPKKSVARDLIVELRNLNHSIYEISDALKERELALSATVRVMMPKAEGFAALPRRREDERPGTRQSHGRARGRRAPAPWHRGASRLAAAACSCSRPSLRDCTGCVGPGRCTARLQDDPPPTPCAAAWR